MSPAVNTQSTAVNTQPLTPQEFVQIVREMASRAPVVEPAATVRKATQRRLARVEQELVEASLAAVDSAPEVQTALGRGAAEVRAEDAEAVDWGIAIETGRQFLNDLSVSNFHRRQRVGLTALQAYQICRALAREPRYARTLAPHVSTMKRLIAKYGTKRQSSPETPAPQQIAA